MLMLRRLVLTRTTHTVRLFSSNNINTTHTTHSSRFFSSNYDDRVREEAQRGRSGGDMVIELLKREFKGETASALGKSSDKTAQAIRELRIIGDEVTKQVEQNSSTVLKSIAKYNAAWQVAVMHRQNLIIQKEATGAVGKVGSMRVDVVKDSMSSGPGTSANEIVREQYPIPKMLDENGRFVVRMSEAYVE